MILLCSQARSKSRAILQFRELTLRVCRSGQTGQTQNLLAQCLQRFESFYPHLLRLFYIFYLYLRVMRKSDYGIIFWIHLFIDVLFIFSWLFFSWWLIAGGVILLYTQFIVLKGCFLSKIEFGKNEACIPYYLHKWRLIKNKKPARIFVGIFLPIIIMTIAIIWQIVFGIKPLIF